MTESIAAVGENKRATLSRELSEFLIELSIALHKHAMYPSDHPSLAPAVAGVVRRADLLLQDRASISLGVAREQLIIEGVATDAKHSVLSDLARRLHRHHLGAITLYKGVDEAEISDLLLTVSADAERDGQPLGLGPVEQLQKWQHARLHALAFERLELLENAGDARPAVEEQGVDAGGGQRVRGAQLWIGLARAAMSGQLNEDEAPPMQPGAVAQAIDDHPSGDAYDQVIVGYLLQIADELRTAGADSAMELRRRTSLLVHKLRPETLQRLVQMGGDGAQRWRFVRDAADGMAVDAVVEILKAAAESSHQQISHSLVRLLSKMAAHAENGAASGRPVADKGLRDQVYRLLSDWELKDPNPGAYGAALERISRANPLFAAPGAARFIAGDERIIQTAIEVGSTGPRVETAILRLASSGKTGAMLDLLDKAPRGPVSDSLRKNVATVENIAKVLAEEPVDFALLDRLVAVTGPAAAQQLVETLVGTESRSVRYQLISRLKQLGPAIFPYLTARLEDAPWYVLRNALLLIDELGVMPTKFSPRLYTAHADSRVRKFALKLQMKIEREKLDALTAALSDADPEIILLGLLGLPLEIPERLSSTIERLATDQTADSDTRVHAIRALSRSTSSSARAVLVSLVDGGRSIFGKLRLAPKSPEMLAALRALATSTHNDPTAADMIARAAASSDAEIRETTSRIGVK